MWWEIFNFIFYIILFVYLTRAGINLRRTSRKSSRRFKSLTRTKASEWQSLRPHPTFPSVLSLTPKFKKISVLLKLKSKNILIPLHYCCSASGHVYSHIQLSLFKFEITLSFWLFYKQTEVPSPFCYLPSLPSLKRQGILVKYFDSSCFILLNEFVKSLNEYQLLCWWNIIFLSLLFPLIIKY